MKTDKHKILVPIDFSEQSLIALKQSYNLARLFNAEIYLLYVIEEIPAIFNVLKIKHDRNKIKKEIRVKLIKLADEITAKTGISVKIKMSRGDVDEKIVEEANKLEAKLIIMGVKGKKSKLKNRLIGSNSLKVVKQASCPVITIRGKKHRDGCRVILLPLDLTKQTAQKVNTAVRLAKLFNGATISLVSILITNDKVVVDKLTAQMIQTKEKVESMGVNCTAEFVKVVKGYDTIASGVIAYSNKAEADLIMIMTQQERDPVKFFIGSSAQTIISDSDVPVMSILPE